MSEIKTADFIYQSDQGLSEDQIQQMRQKYGKNELTPPQRSPWWRELLAKFDDPTIQILIAAAAISLFITAVERYGLQNEEVSFVDSIGIFLAVALATLVGFFSERKSAREFELLNKVKDDITVKILREGQIGTISITEIVVGDVIRIDPGDKVPADGVLLESMGLYIDQAMLTGESVPAKKKDFNGSLDWEKLVAVKSGDDCFVARGTMVADGYGFFLVTAVGDQTQMGKIAQALSNDEGAENETPLVQKLSRLAKQISIVGVVAAISIFTVMAIIAAIQSPLLKELFYDSTSAVIVLGLAIFSGWLLERFALRPFFSSMGMVIKSRRLAFLTMIPMVIASFTIFLGLWEMILSDHGNQLGAGIDLLKNVLLAFVVAVTIIVVAVPEGLPMMVTVSLAMNMMKMARENCLVRKLIASETIGSATIICTDKTGTLTENRMTPVHIFAEDRNYSSKDFHQLTVSSVWEHFFKGIAINSEANLHIEKESSGKETVTGVGNPTECALLKFLYEQGISYQEEREKVNRCYELGHNSERKMSLAVVKEQDNSNICYLKGAPERILAKCSTILINGQVESIDPHKKEIEQSLRDASEDALRVIALSEKRFETDCEGCRNKDPQDCLACSGHCFIGFVGIADPVRAEVPQAVQQCLDAHVQVKMITGDALPTAVAIAKAAGIYKGTSNEIVLTSDDFAAVSDENLPETAEKIRVLARSTPMDKLRLVKALHKRGEVVAMTGDGTNDAPALKFADVGLSMGITGTEVAKEASDIVLVDDNFKSIVTGVWWGRTLFQNIQRFLQFQLSVNVVALLCALIGPLVGVPLPLTVTQLLWINIIMDTFAALALSTDPPRPHTMKEKPIPRNAHIITGTMGVSILVVSLYQVAILFAALFLGWFVDPQHQYNSSIAATDPNYLEHNLQALTVFFTILVMFQFWHKFNCRALRHDESPFTLLTKNHLFLTIVLTITAAQIIMVQMPSIGRFFRTEPLSLRQWIDIALLTVTVIPVAWFGRKLAYWIGVNQ
ncbi:MAG: cation-translocating P-type ATPase [Planctomycetia bacterium]|nr:cation-translocating P-type ATPase [Planctomycetia bacterium]